MFHVHPTGEVVTTMRVRLNLSYDGTDFRGWQVQPEGRTVQGELERSLGKFYGGADIRTYAAGRTDAGVHAVMQVVHFEPPVERENTVIIKGLNALLPDDIQIWEAREVEDDFHARFSARGRLYAYRLLKSDNLFFRRYGWIVDPSFSIHAAEEVSAVFLGKHDFRAFSTQPDLEESTVCDVRYINWHEDVNGWIMEIEADRFIRRLVRTLTGSVVSLVTGKVDPVSIRAALDNVEGRVPPPAPSEGLALVQVRYENEILLDTPPASLWGTFPLP
jgi:tRNA pseudouridine38-40 synthase